MLFRIFSTPFALAAFAFLPACSRSDASPAAPATASSATAATAPPAAADASATPRPPFNVLLITIDSLRADMPWAGYKRPIAPRLTELANRATVYTQAYSTSSFTSKSLVGFLSGRYPSELARTGVFFTRYRDNPPFLCELLGKEQIPCMTGQAHAYLDKGYAGLDRGFAEWRLVPKITFDYNTDPHVTSQKLTPLALEQLGNEKLRGDGTHPFFAWYHFMDPHDKYQGHEESPHWGTRPRDLYDEEVFFTDMWIGKLLDYVAKEPWGARTAIIVSADHGEAFGEHGRIKHAHELYEELVHVPLMVVVPGQPARHIEATRSALDLTPTIADLLGAKPLEGLHGKSFAPELLGEPPAPSHDIVCDLPEDEFNQRRRTLRHEDWKIIAHGKDQSFELFDLKNDPREDKDLYGKDREATRDMLARYKEASRAIADVVPLGGIPVHKD